ncbi:response regulator [Caldilinea sp.]|uniref:ATP-binding response regulator n=1 Tax=Caldilinea sp. TaxID=2293560 RepID=UPI002B521F25|nr:response regulator [Caldilinea sp.]HRA65647.1 response regulator [Caldilinea sp.]
MMDELTYDQFVALLRSALHYLFDPVHLRRSPLVALLGLSGEFDQAAALQQRLVATIRELKPPDAEPPQSRAWRIYDTLHLQYVRQLARDVVATQLGISERQMRREQRLAIEALAQQLWRPAAPSDQAGEDRPADRQVATNPPPDPTQTLTKELSWLRTPAAEERVPLRAALEDVLTLAQPLARQWHVSLYDELPDELADLSVSPLALRSILLTLLTVAIPRAGNAPVTMTVARQDATIRLSISSAAQADQQAPFSVKEQDALGTAQELAAFYDATLAFASPQGSGMVFLLTLAAPAPLTVLVIDDNADWLELVDRYSSGSRYQIVGANDPVTAAELAETLQPALILLDVMMHNVDGWQVLGELQQEPTTAPIPVIVCTILPLEEMALSLGASAFLQKPVSQQQFLHCLGQQSRLLD